MLVNIACSHCERIHAIVSNGKTHFWRGRFWRGRFWRGRFWRQQGNTPLFEIRKIP